MEMLTLYSMPSSGNSYKVRLLLAHLGIEFKHIPVEYDGSKTYTLTPEFRQLNPTGKVPVVILESGKALSESNAILHYFGEGTRFVPDDKLSRARMYQWMFFEQNMHEGSVAVRRAIHAYPNREMDRSPERLQSLLDAGHAALDVMEVQLKQTEFLTGPTFSLADISLYAYTHGCDTVGGFDLVSRPGICAWVKRVASQPGHVALDWLPSAEDESSPTDST